MSVGVWVKQGVVLPKASDFCAQPNVLYESGAVILTPNADGKIFRMWFDNDNAQTNTTNGPCYAESNDGISWTRYAVTVPLFSPTSANTYSRMYKNVLGDGLYYYFTGGLQGPIQVWNSPDGITWTQRNANAIARGTAGAWDDGFICLLNVAGKIGSTYYGYYSGAHGNVSPVSFGLATSTDLINWTKGPSNPVITAFKPANFFWQRVGSTLYGWTIIQLPNIPGAPGQLPSDFMRFSAPNPTGPFTALGVCTYYRTVFTVDGIGLTSGQVADPCLLEFNGNVYMWHTVGNTSPGGIALAIAPMTLAQLVQTYEGVQNIPTPQSLSLTLGPLNSDPFTGPDANPIGGNWTAYQTFGGSTSFAPAQRSGNLCMGTVAGKNSDSFWNANSFNNDQWAQITTGASAAGSSMGVILRANSLGCYRVYWSGTTGGAAGTWTIQRYVVSGNSFNVVLTRISANNNDVIVNVGDTITGTIVGSTISIYHNGNLVATGTDANFASGSVGFVVTPLTLSTNAAISAWSGGNITSAPPAPTPSSNSAGTQNDMLQLNRWCTRLWG